jgi:prolyl oligopeptidase
MSIPTEKSNAADFYHGHEVQDPYRWLEEAEHPETKAWAEKQNQITRSYFEELPVRNMLQERLARCWNAAKFFTPEKVNGEYFFQKNNGLQNQPVLYRTSSLSASEPDVVINPNELNPEGTTALTALSFSGKGTWLAYALSENGSDWQTFRIRNLETGKDLPETIRWCKFTDIAWTKDEDGFYYSRYPEPGTVPEEDGSNHNRLYFHRLNTLQSEDRLIHERPDDKELSFGATFTDDHRHLILQSWKGTENKSRLYYREATSDGDFLPLAPDGDGYYSYLGNSEGRFILYTTAGAPNGRIISVDPEHPEKEHWQDIIPEQESVLYFPKLAGDHLIAAYMEHAWHRVELYRTDGTHVRRLGLPEMISVSNIQVSKKDGEVLIGYTSYLTPMTIARYTIESDELDTVLVPEGGLDPDLYTTRQVFYPSTDGTQIPMFITSRKDLSPDGSHPVLLYGYGGFNISMTPAFNASNAMFIEDGGIYAVANIRGGGEYGEEWHQGGTFGNKPQVFDDFISAAEWLIAEKWTKPEKIAIMGGSNGGLLVAACLNRRPELFGAVICQVPVTDMLRYHKFTVGRFWTSEFGHPEENEEDFRNIIAYSPLHNIKEREHPPVLITTADTDDRVVPHHAMKYAAAMQEAQKGDAPILIRIEKDAGHGLGKPVSKIIDEHSDIYSFLYTHLDMDA